MKLVRHRGRSIVCGGMALGLATATCLAELKTFTIDPARSSLRISGTFAGFNIEPQAPGSLVTSYEGTIEAEVTGSDIVFLGGSVIAALTNGNWQPAAGGAAGSAPANYGGQVVNLFVNGRAALRNVRFDLTSGVLPLNDGHYEAQELLFNFIPGGDSVIDYTYSITLGGSGNASQALYGTSPNAVSTNGTLEVRGDETELTIPVDISGALTVVSLNDVQYRFRGQLVAAAAAPAPVEIHSFHVNAGQLYFSIATVPGQSYTILGSTNLEGWSEILDQFTATETLTERTLAMPASQPQYYFRVRQGF